MRDIDDIYKRLSMNDIPWNMEIPPLALVNLVESGQIQPCRCIDLGCGIGNYTIYLCKKKFDVVGIDISPTAIQLAKNNARNKGIACEFVVADILHITNRIKGPFDFAFDWEVLHHVFPEEREQYVRSVYNLLASQGTYLSVCFSDKDPHFGGKGKYRQTPIGTRLYFSSEYELVQLFSQYFTIVELKTIETRGKYDPHLVNYVFMKKKQQQLPHDNPF